MRSNLVSWQWQGYPEFHRDRKNLALHLVTAPLFPGGALLVLLGAILGPWWLVLAGLGGMLAALALQGRGHRGEASPPIPFDGFGDFVSRFFVEQMVNLPRFVLSGGWLRAWRAAGASPGRA